MGAVVSIVLFPFYLLVFKENLAAWIGWVIMVVRIIISLPFFYFSSKYLPITCTVSAIPAGITPGHDLAGGSDLHYLV